MNEIRFNREKDLKMKNTIENTVLSAFNFGQNADTSADDPAPVAGEPSPPVEPVAPVEPPKVQDKAKPSDEEAKLLKEVMAQKAKAKELQAKLDAVADIDPEAARAALKEAAELKAKREQDELKALEEKGEFSRIVEQINQKNEEKLSAVLQEVEALKQANAAKEQALIAKEKSIIFSSSNFIKENILISGTKVEVLLGDYFDYDAEQGSIIAYDKPKGAKDRTPIVNEKGSNVDFETALEKIITSDKDFASLVKSNVKPGAQSKTVNFGATVEEPKTALGVTSAQIEALFKAKK